MPEFSEPKFKDIHISDNELIQKVDFLAESLEHYARITKDIYPALSFDGSNFNAWSNSLIKPGPTTSCKHPIISHGPTWIHSSNTT
ncbi:hypothetical protein O181_016399 [Austropuccinia psidii MF-1]|uniref:Uncharacterized protein n=1 Tax=Austropuccinia psidii MF-1 TaxID=1389203 RepID=A0A9Q3C1M5_9BASI|nr:hypothetical protein [Austropuccinia psidii MF-1]